MEGTGGSRCRICMVRTRATYAYGENGTVHLLLRGSWPLALPDTASNDRDTGSLSSCQGPQISVRTRDRHRICSPSPRSQQQRTSPTIQVCLHTTPPRATSHEPKAGTSSRPATQALGSQLSSSMYVSKFVLLRASRLAPRASRPGPKQRYQEPKMPQSSRHLPPPTSHDAHHSMPPRPASRLRRYRCATASQTQDARHETRDA